MKELPQNREQLIAEIDTVAKWYEAINECDNNLKQCLPPKDYAIQTYPEFKDSKEKGKSLSDFCGACLFGVPLIGYPYFLYTYFSDTFNERHFYPDGFFVGILILVLGFIVIVLSGAFIGLLVDHIINPDTPEKEAQRRKQYEENKKAFDEKQRLAKQTNDNCYNENIYRKNSLLNNPPNTFIPKEYQDPLLLRCLIKYIQDYRADTFKEALNLYLHDLDMQRLSNPIEYTKQMAIEAMRAGNSATAESMINVTMLMRIEPYIGDDLYYSSYKIGNIRSWIFINIDDFYSWLERTDPNYNKEVRNRHIFFKKYSIVEDFNSKDSARALKAKLVLKSYFECCLQNNGLQDFSKMIDLQTMSPVFREVQLGFVQWDHSPFISTIQNLYMYEHYGPNWIDDLIKDGARYGLRFFDDGAGHLSPQYNFRTLFYDSMSS